MIFSGAFLSLRAKMIVETVAHYRAAGDLRHFRRTLHGRGGLMHYFSDILEQFRLTPFYVDRILKGTKPGDLPVQLPTKFKLTINRKTASALWPIPARSYRRRLLNPDWSPRCMAYSGPRLRCRAVHPGQADQDDMRHRFDGLP